MLEVDGTPPSRGRAAIADRFAEAGRRLAAAAEHAYVRHLVSSPRIDVEGPDAARSTAYFFVLTEVGPDHWGRYRDRFERRAGEWRIAERHVVVEGRTRPSRMT